jgi:hypothetical protein
LELCPGRLYEKTRFLLAKRSRIYGTRRGRQLAGSGIEFTARRGFREGSFCQQREKGVYVVSCFGAALWYHLLRGTPRLETESSGHTLISRHGFEIAHHAFVVMLLAVRALRIFFGALSFGSPTHCASRPRFGFSNSLFSCHRIDETNGSFDGIGGRTTICGCGSRSNPPHIPPTVFGSSNKMFASLITRKKRFNLLSSL